MYEVFTEEVELDLFGKFFLSEKDGSRMEAQFIFQKEYLQIKGQP